MNSLPNEFRLDDLRVHLGLMRVQRGAVDLALPKLSFELLLVLARAAPSLVSIDELMSQVWSGLVVNPETVVQRVKLLRDVLGDDPKAPRYIAGLRGRGYRLIPAVIATTNVAASAGIDDERAIEVRAEPAPAEPMGPLERARNPLEHDRTVVPGSPAPITRQASAHRRWLVIGLICIAVGGSAVLWRRFYGAHGVQVAPGAPVATDTRNSVTVSALPTRTVAVLPFDDLSLKHDNGQLALALPEMVLQRLGSVKQLIVIARSSSFSFIGQQVDAREIGRRLSARYLVEGALQRVGDRIRVSAQLIDAQSGEQMRSLSFDRQLRDIFELQDDIASQVAAALQVQLLGADLNRVDRSRSTSLDAYLHYLDAVALLNRWTVRDAEHAATELEQTLKIDSTFALAYAELARARWLVQFLRGAKREDNKYLLPLVEKALALDPRLGEAYAVRGILDSDPKVAEADFRKALELAPNYGPAYESYAEALHDDLNRPEEGLAMIERATLIDPIAPRNLYTRGLYLLFDKNQESDAEHYFLQALAIDPSFPPANARLAEMRWAKGELAQGIKLIERAIQADPQARWIRAAACAMYLDADDRQAASNVTAGLPVDPEATVLLATYDRDFRKAAALRGEDMTTSATIYAYWISIDAVARQNGSYAQSINTLHRAIHMDGTAASLESAIDKNFIGAYALADLYRAQGNTTAASHVLVGIKRWVDKYDVPPGLPTAAERRLSGDATAAFDFLSQDIARQHMNIWWIVERDPSWAELKSDPRFVAQIAIERERVAKQRVLILQMQNNGEIPRRSSSAPVVAKKTQRAS